MTSTAVAGARVRNGPCTVLVTDAGRGAAVATIRSLARAGHRVIAADEARVSPGRWSRHAEGSVRYPDPYRDPLAAAARIAQACRARGISLDNVASKLGITRVALTLILNGQDPIARNQLDVLHKIINNYNAATGEMG